VNKDSTENTIVLFFMEEIQQLVTDINITNKDVRQIEIHTVEPLAPDPSPFEVEIAIAKLKRYKSPGSGQIWQNLFKHEVKYYIIRSMS
jgi:hypothetical protein